jgi:hypothetical protein
MGSPTRGAWVCRHGVDGRDPCPECYGEPAENWIIRSLRAMYQGEPGYDEAAALARFHAGVERMETDPEYAAYIRRLAEEADMDWAALGGTECSGLTADPDGPEPAP